jgi:toxin ParE1/3/4
VTPAWLRPLAEADLVERSRYYAAHADDVVAERFFDSAMAALRAIERMRGTGSPRIGELCNVPGLRVRRIEGFRCGWFYFVRGDHLDVARILADDQDLAAFLAESSDD